MDEVMNFDVCMNKALASKAWCHTCGWCLYYEYGLDF